MNSALGPNRNLIDKAGSRWQLSTPALVLDLDACEKNIQAMARHCQGTGQALRPHGKSHKCSEIAKRQIEAGAVGICCATIREAETMVAAGLPGVLITSPVATPAKIRRLMALHAETDSLMVVTDSLSNATALAEAARAGAAGRPLKLLADFDVGLQRTGAPDAESVHAIARFASGDPAVSFAGLQAYAGHLQHVENWRERADAMAAEVARVAAVVAHLREAGIETPLVTGGGTGTHDIDHRLGQYNELQAGSYVFTDIQYNQVVLRQETPRPFTPSLFVQAAVINTHFDSHAVIDAGLKSLATDGPTPEFAADGAPEGAAYRYMGDEHGAVVYAAGSNARLAIGDPVSLVVPHCDPNVNLFDHYHCVQGDRLVAIWPIDARGNP